MPTSNETMQSQKWLSRILTALIAAYALAAILQIGVQWNVFQVNFRLYYYAGMAFRLGLNPYDQEVLAKLAGSYILPCGYLPIVLHLFTPLSWLEYLSAYRLFLILKVLILAFLVWIWHAKFLRTGIDNVFLLVCLFGFNYAIYWDLQAGNINLLEQALIWAGLYAYTREKWPPYILCIVLASAFKITPAFFLLLLLFVQGRGKWKWIFAAAIMLVALHGMNYLCYPELFKGFMQNINKMQGIVSASTPEARPNFEGAPATWPLINAIADKVAAKAGVNIPGIVPAMCFGLIGLVVCAVSWLAVRRCPSLPDNKSRIDQVMLACLVYLLLTPRLMVYSYVIGLLPAYYVVRELKEIRAAWALLALMSISTIEGRPPILKLLVEALPHYYPLLIAYALWALCMYLLLIVRPRDGSWGK